MQAIPKKSAGCRSLPRQRASEGIVMHKLQPTDRPCWGFRRSPCVRNRVPEAIQQKCVMEELGL